MLRNHYGDETLLGFLDGELTAWKGRQVKCHLQECWDCRARVGELEGQIELLANSARHPVFPSPDFVEDGRRKVLARIRAAHESPVFTPRFESLPRRDAGRLARLALGTAACVCLTVLSAWLAARHRAVPATEVLSRARQVETSLYQSPMTVHQAIQVEAVEIRPTRRTRSGRLAVWAEGNDRFALRWEEQTGLLRHAVWRPSMSREYLYDPRLSANPVARSVRTENIKSLTELAQYGLTLEELETSFVRWLDSQGWRPISLGADFSEFAGQSGVTLVAERIRTKAGGRGIRITARRLQAKIRIELSMDVDAASDRPTIEVVRFETPERAVEFRLSVDRIELLRPSSVRAAVYEPDLPMAQPAPPPQDRRPLPPPPAAIASQSPLNVLSDPNVQVQALSDLHSVKACLGDDIKIRETPSGSWQIRGLVPNVERKVEVLNALSGLPIRAQELDIRTFEEVSAAAPNEHCPETPLAPPLSSSIIVRQGVQRLPVEDLLAQESLKREVGQRIAEIRGELPRLSNHAVTLSKSMLSEAWALQDLAERFPARSIHKLSHSSRHSLEEMVRDHQRNFQEQLSRLRDHFEPVLSLLAPSAIGPVHAGIAPQAIEGDWTASCLAIWQCARRVDKVIHGLFAGTDLEGEPPAAAIAELLAELGALGLSVPRFGAEITGNFLQRPATDARRIEYQERVSPDEGISPPVGQKERTK